MSAAGSLAETLVGGGVSRWVPVVLRLVAGVLLVPAAVLKFANYGEQAAFFAEIGVPAAGVTVLLVAVLELCAGVAIVLGAGARVAAIAVVPVMLTAMALDGVVPTNAAVLVACLGIAALGPGDFAVWGPVATPLDALSN